MPDSSFFTPMQMGGMQPGQMVGDPSMPMAGMPPMLRQPTPVADPKLKATYRNVYGTQFNAGYQPVSNTGSVDATFPIGDHQKQLFFNAGGYVKPNDWGASIGITKKIAPQPISVGDALNRIIPNSAPVSDSGVSQVSDRSGFYNSLTPEQLKLLSQEVQTKQRESVDRALGIVPGANKYEARFGVDVPTRDLNIPANNGDFIPGDGRSFNPDPTEFARNYANRLPQQPQFMNPYVQQ